MKVEVMREMVLGYLESGEAPAAIIHGVDGDASYQIVCLAACINAIREHGPDSVTVEVEEATDAG